MKVYLQSQKGSSKYASEDRILVGSEVFADQEAVRFLDRGHVLLADGVGGNNAGAVAAFQVCKKMSEVDELRPEAFSAINEHLFSMGVENENYRNMATTATGVLFSSTTTAVSYHVGNTRLYAIQAGEYLKQLTSDDTVVEYLIRTGKLTEEEAKNYPARNEITSCFGGGKASLLRIKVDNINLAQFHHFLLTCDGIHDYLTLDEMEDILGQCNGDWSKAIGELITRAKESGSPDDCSAVIIDCDLSSIESCCDVNDEQKHEPIQQNNPGSTIDCISDEYAQNIKVAPSSTESMSSAKNKLWNFFKKKPEHREE